MPSRLNSILGNGEAKNGVRQLLEEIRTHQCDMPPEARDDMIFGALVVLYDLGKDRSDHITTLRRINVGIFLTLFVIFLTILALHGDVPWLTGLFEHIFGL